MLTHVAAGPEFNAVMKKLGSTMEKHDWVFCPECVEKAKREGRTLTDGDKWFHLIHFRDGRRCCVNCANGVDVKPDEYRQSFATFKEYDWNKKALWKAREFAAGLGGLYLYGDPGLGKSHLLNAAYHTCCTMGREAKRVVWDDFLRDLKATFGGASNAEKELFDSVVNPEYLLLDDIKCNVDNPEFSINTMYTILNAREIKLNMKTFITSNMSNSTWAKADKRVASRIMGMCGADGIVKINGEDQRVRG